MLVTSGLLESHTSKDFPLFCNHLNCFSGNSLVRSPALEPIQRASVFLLFSLRPDILQNFLLFSVQLLTMFQIHLHVGLELCHLHTDLV